VKRILFVASLVVALAGTAPAYALMCNDSRESFEFNFGFHIGEPYTERELNSIDLMRLRRIGVDTDRVERWSGCIRAFVNLPGGGQEMWFFDPRTLERVR
jgi:hypothetical protein